MKMLRGLESSDRGDREWFSLGMRYDRQEIKDTSAMIFDQNLRAGRACWVELNIQAI
jgi:hypothetical protein